MNKTSIKRAAAGLLALLLTVAGLHVFALGDEIVTERQSMPTGEVSQAIAYDENDPGKSFAGYTPDYKDYLDSGAYALLRDLRKLYTETHLYDFSEEDVAEAFVMKLLHDHPELFPLFANALLGTMDEYSAYYEHGTGMASDGMTRGYGILVSDETDYRVRGREPGVYIVDVLYNSSALAAGIRRGDRLLDVEGYDVRHATVDAAMNYVAELPYVAKEQFDENGESLGIPNEPEFILDERTGRKVYPLHLRLERDGVEFEVALRRGAMLESPIVLNIPEDGSYAYIGIVSFAGDTVTQDFAAALAAVRKSGIENVIFDVRDNGGGYLEAAQAMANLLIPDERVLYYLNERGAEKPEPVSSDGTGKGFEKIAVLVNGASASASELFAMILNQNCGALLVGEQTFGKGVGQESYMMQNGDLFTITAFEVLTPRKTSYNTVGLTPDVEITPCLTRYAFPERLERFNYINYVSLVEGAKSETVLGFEKRLNMMGYLRDAYVDGTYDRETTTALIALQLYLDKEPTGVLDIPTVDYITAVINRFKNYYFRYDSQFEVAVKSFSSRSQAKRLAKELERDSRAVEQQQKEYEEAVLAAIRAEEEADKQAQAAQNGQEVTGEIETEQGKNENE